MALTTQQQTSILQLTQVMLDATPGAIYLNFLGAQIMDGKSFADLAQFLSGTNTFFGHMYIGTINHYDDPYSLAINFVEDLVGDHASTENKTWAKNYIIDKMTAGATQAEVVSELTQGLSVIPASDPNWGEASTYYNTRIAEKVVSRLVGNTITADDEAFAVNHILTQMAAGQTFGAMVEWAITALDRIDHADPVWGNAAALFDNRTEVSRYYSVDKIGAATSALSLQYLLTQAPPGGTYIELLMKTTLLRGMDSVQSAIALSTILAGVTADAATVVTAKVAMDNFLKDNINMYGLNGSNGFRLNGGIGGHMVSSAGDFNGDGFGDLMIAAYYSDSSDLVSDTSFVVFGKSSGLGATLDLSSMDGSNGFRLDGIAKESSDGFLISNAGDVNADGFDDLIIGTLLSKSDSRDPGAVHVIFGKAAGFTATLDLSSLDGSNGFRINGAVVGEDLIDFISSAGDFNGDGYADIIIGSPLDDSSYLVFGKASGFDAVLDLSNLRSDQGFRLYGTASGNLVSTAGDMNGDGFDDLIINASLNGKNPGPNYVVFGKANGFNAPLDLSHLDGSNGFRLDSTTVKKYSGHSSSISTAGDVNGDGFDDVIIGAPGANSNGKYTGSSYVIFGKASGFNAVLDLSGLNGSNGFRLDGERRYDDAGSSVSSIGDFNGDGFDDLVIGAIHAAPDGFRVGANYVVFGKASGFSAALALSSLDESSGLILKGLETDNRLGGPASGADVNGDGFDDLIMSVSNKSILDLGSSYVVFGGNFTHAVTFLGTPGADNFPAGSTLSESFVAGDGNDLMSSGGGSDVFHAGAGDDIIKVSGFDFRIMDGGAGNDTLVLTSSDLNLDLAKVRGKIEGIETIDLTGNGNNTLIVNRLDLLKLSDTSNTLKVNGNTGDVITGLDSDWTDGGITGDYHTYTFDAAILLVGINVTTDFI